jgi:hypothetical protein
LHVPGKHISLLTDPCDLVPDLTQKHFLLTLLKIIQCDISARDNKINETIRRVEKAASGSPIVLDATVFWLRDMDPKSAVEEWSDVACAMIDWAIGSSTCRGQMESDQDSLKSLKAEYTAAVKQLRIGLSYEYLLT